ncbi:MAG: ABC transporter ATP-binding protein [Corynebacterium sp.]|nr:ABC transporter ATP-binding protein [Corynebacterium sp.]
MPLLSVQNLTVTTGATTLVHDVTFDLEPGERLGVIGESGSGKSLTALSIMGLLPDSVQAKGDISFRDQQLLGLADSRFRKLRGKSIAMVFQEPMSALDPLMRVEKQLRFALGHKDTAAALAEVGLSPQHGRRFPHELSGGQRQRVMIAMALAGQPDILLCDEPTTALDATTQNGILELIEKLVAQRNLTLVFISHDLAVVSRMCTHVVVMEKGVVVERGVLATPQHPYTQRLVAAARPKPPLPAPNTGDPIVIVDHVSKSFGTVTALDDVNLHVRRGARLGIVGSSGSGKSTLLSLIAGLTTPTTGSLEVNGRVHMVFQDPLGSLNPRMRIRDIIAEAIPAGDVDAQVAEVLTEVGLDPSHAQRYPHEFSGGQRQRISIARAVVSRPDIILADEAVSALDVSVRAQVLDLFQRIVAEHNLTLIFVSHDLNVIRHLCSEVAVITDGKIVECGTVHEVWTNPTHPYTRTLLNAIVEQ